MKTTAYFATEPLGKGAIAPLTLLTSTPPRLPDEVSDRPSREELRHILLGSPDAIQQAIHRLHQLNYAEPGLWSPLVRVEDRLIITPSQGAAMRLLKRIP